MKIKLIAILAVLLFVIVMLVKFEKNSDTEYGVTFTPKYARFLGLDWQKTYLAVLDDLKVKNLRLPSYWEVLEKEEGELDFSETDFMLNEAAQRGVKVSLVLGIRQPRWPECHMPDWVRSLPLKQRQQKALEFIEKVVQRYKNNQAVVAWQVENEPFVWWFGEGCDPLYPEFLQSEIDLVKSLDQKPIIITDSGEWGGWWDSASAGDILGVSIYKKAYNNYLKAYTPYLFPPIYYALKANLVGGEVVVTELQAEPWFSVKDPREKSPEFQGKLFSISDFKNNVDFARNAGFEKVDLWGVEWWYFMAQSGHPEYLDYAKSLFK